LYRSVSLLKLIPELGWLISTNPKVSKRLENSHRAAADTTFWAEEQNQSAGHDQQEAQREWRKLDIEMDVISPTRPAPSDQGPGSCFMFLSF